MSVFPSGFTAFANALRTMVVLADDGTTNGKVTLAQALGLITGADMLSPLLGLNDVVEELPATTTSYTVLPADKNKVKRFLCSADCAVFLPAGMPVGFAFEWTQSGAGTLSFQTAAGAGQSIGSPEGARSGGLYGTGSLRVVAPNIWYLSGYTKA